MISCRHCILVSLLVVLAGCANQPPTQQDNLCLIFEQYPEWYEDAVAMEKKWGTPIQIAMSFIKQESAYRHDSQPPRYYALGFIPWGRLSSAYGYAQAQDGTWDDFQAATDHGGARDNFDDALMFIGWYTNQSRNKLGLSLWDSYNQYLAYHEGWTGYQRRYHRNKPNLLRVAKRVETVANNYGWQLKQCRAKLEDQRNSSWW